MNRSIVILVSACSLAAAALSISGLFGNVEGKNSLTSANIHQIPEKTPDLRSKQDHSDLPGIEHDGKAFALYEGLKDVFDALILETGAPQKDAMLNLANQHCQTARLTSRGCGQFIELFSRYVDYKMALSSIEAQTSNYAAVAAEIEHRLDQIDALQFQYFSENEIHVLFGAEKKTETKALARFKIAHDSTLSREQKEILIQHHFESMPENEKAAFLPSLQMQSLHRIKKMPTSQQHKLELVRAQFGDEAASRLSASWDQQAQFRQRLLELKDEYQHVAKENQLEWLAQHFQANQAKRARALMKRM